MVCGHRAGKPAGLSVKQEAVSDAHGVSEEQVHLHIAVTAEGSLVDSFVTGRNDGHGKVKAPEAVSAHIALPFQRTAVRQDEDLVLDVTLHPYDGNPEGIGLQVLILPVQSPFGQDEFFCVVNGERLNEDHGEPRISKHL